MNMFLSDIRQTLIPGFDSRHGPLPTMLVCMTMVTGLVDSFSFLRLGHVFVANSTGNILFIGFALAHVPGFSIAESLLSLGAFVVGATIGGKLNSVFETHRGRILGASTSLQAFLLAVAVVLSLVCTVPVQSGYRSAFIAVLAIAMGIQNAAVRKIAVPDLTTTVLTLTITGLGADSVLVGGTGSRAGRRLVAIAAMLIGAVVGAILVLHAALCYPLVASLFLILIVAVWVTRAGKTNDTWTKA
jgi:uncharacterized membrane protein YoaK (UPF0700 family)